MNKKIIVTLILLLPLKAHIKAMEENPLGALGYEKVEKNDLETFDYKAASVLPRFKDMVMIARESKGRSKGLYADFGGFKSRTMPETPTKTAARELYEESAGELVSKSTEESEEVAEIEKYIDIAGKNSECAVANVQLKHVLFITHFEQEMVEKFGLNFFELQKAITEKNVKKKMKLLLLLGKSSMRK